MLNWQDFLWITVAVVVGGFVSAVIAAMFTDPG